MTVREQAYGAGVQAVVMMSGEHFSNFFYDNLPQIVIGLGEGHVGPREKWLQVPEVLVPGEPGLAAPPEILDMPKDELMEAGNGTGEVRSWVALAGAMRGHGAKALVYEPIYGWINGMGVVTCDLDPVGAPA